MDSLNYFKRTGATALKLLLCLVFVLCMVPVFGLAATARAEGGLQISTAYPGTTVKAGSDNNFPIKVANDTDSPQNVVISVEGLPDGWKGYYSNSGNTITRVYVEKGSSSSVTLNISIPQDAAEKAYGFNLKADSGTGYTSSFYMELTVSKNEAAKGKFTTQFSDLAGSSSTTFKFSTTIANNSGADQSYSLSASAPTGWTVTFVPSYESQQIASISVANGASQGIDVNITPSSSAPAGKNAIKVTAVSAQETLSVDLNVQITGTYSMSVMTGSGVLSGEAYAGKETLVALKITNSGSVDLNNINLDATVPEKWTVRFDMATIPTIAAGNTQTVNAYIKPANNAIAGDYNVVFSAATNETSSQVTFRVSLLTSSIWWIIALVVIVALIVGLFLLFTKLGRR